MADEASILEPSTEQPSAHPSGVSDTEQISDAQRSGSITGIGIVLGFSLTFAGQWSLGAEAWHYLAVVPLAFAIAGIYLQLRALLRVLSLPRITVDDHKFRVNQFIWGVSIVLTGYVIGVFIDLGVDKGWLPRF